jgi:hypothetical protein
MPLKAVVSDVSGEAGIPVLLKDRLSRKDEQKPPGGQNAGL